MRPAPTRAETYCSKVLWKVPRWRRSKASTAGSWVTPERDWEMTDCEMPLAAASREMLATKVLKSPPHWAARVGVERRRKGRRRKRRSGSMKVRFLRTNRYINWTVCSTYHKVFREPQCHRRVNALA